MPWHGRLQLDYSLQSQRSVARFGHEGPLRVLQSLYPEGDAVCHNVLAHPPGGLVSGDRLDIQVNASGRSHGLITTPTLLATRRLSFSPSCCGSQQTSKYQRPNWPQ